LKKSPRRREATRPVVRLRANDHGRCHAKAKVQAKAKK